MKRIIWLSVGIAVGVVVVKRIEERTGVFSRAFAPDGPLQKYRG